MKKQALALSVLFSAIILIFCVNMGTGGDKYSTKAAEPTYAAPEAKEGNFHGKIYDEETTSEVTNLSFYGHTTIGGILRDTDDSTNTLDLSKIKEIRIDAPVYDSKRHRDKDVTLASIISIDGTETTGLLFPRRVTVCGEEKGSKIKRSWFISKLTKIEVEGADNKKPVSVAPEKVEASTPEKTPEVKQEKAETKTVQTPQEKSTSVTATTQTTGITSEADEPKKPKGVVEAFRGIIDSIIDFVKSIVNFFINLFR